MCFTFNEIMNKIKFFSNISQKYYKNNEIILRNNLNNTSIQRLFTSIQDNNHSKGDTSEEWVDNRDRDRSQVISPELSIEYMKSTAFKESYAHYRVWQLFRRNFKGQLSPMRSRTTCVVNHMIYTSNPCPVCRDKYLVLHYSNIDLLNHFINPYSGYVYENTILCLCAQQYEKLLVAINLAKDYGLLTFELPLRTYDYKDYNPI